MPQRIFCLRLRGIHDLGVVADPAGDGERSLLAVDRRPAQIDPAGRPGQDGLDRLVAARRDLQVGGEQVAVPVGMMPSAIFVSASAVATWRTAPSPPTATTTSRSSLSAPARGTTQRRACVRRRRSSISQPAAAKPLRHVGDDLADLAALALVARRRAPGSGAVRRAGRSGEARLVLDLESEAIQRLPVPIRDGKSREEVVDGSEVGGRDVALPGDPDEAVLDLLGFLRRSSGRRR